jgi:hypothetical protein
MSSVTGCRTLLLGCLAVLVAACGTAAGSPPTVVAAPDAAAAKVTSISQIKPLVASARLVRAIRLGDGALRLDPPSRDPGLREVDAVRVWAAATTGGQQLTGTTVVFLADASVRVPVALPDYPTTLSRWARPRFVHRTVWAIASGTDVMIMCPYMTSSPVVTPQVGTVTLVAADDSGEGVTYSSGAPVCDFPPRAPSAEVSSYVATVPTTTPAGTPNQRTPTPPCGSFEASASGSDSTGARRTVDGLRVWMIGNRCESSMSVAALLRRPLNSLLGNLAPGRMSQETPGRVSYFDGRMHTFPS